MRIVSKGGRVASLDARRNFNAFAALLLAVILICGIHPARAAEEIGLVNAVECSRRRVKIGNNLRLSRSPPSTLPPIP